MLMICRAQSAESIHAWIVRNLPEGPSPPVSRPFNYVKFLSVTTATLGAITLFTVAAPYVWPIVQNRNLWAAICLIAVLMFTSGTMFNHIRKVPYVSGDGKGSISYFAGGFQNQYGLETQIVAAICAYSSSTKTRVMLTTYRWHSRLRNHHSDAQGPPYCRSQDPAGSCTCLGCRCLPDVQLLAQRLQVQEWRLPLLLASILDVDGIQELSKIWRERRGYSEASYDPDYSVPAAGWRKCIICSI